MQAVLGTDAVSRIYGDGWTCSDDDRVRSYLARTTRRPNEYGPPLGSTSDLPRPTNSTLVTFGCK
jgi:hypothetical protein